MTIRILELQGGLNFRDLGGYPTTDGRSVKWKILYRSGTSHAMSLRDIHLLSALGIRFAFDFRSNEEREAHSARFTLIPDLYYEYQDHHHVAGDIRRLLESPNARPDDSHDLMISMYRQLPYDFRKPLQRLFQMLEQGNLPLVFNCSAGKDRTGIAAALVLSALGVSRDVIMEDYMLTEHCFDQSCALLLNQSNMRLFERIGREVWEPLMRVHPNYLNAMFDRLTDSHGSVHNYLAEVLGVDANVAHRLRNQLLQ
jgi:protein-tyrosine phosphatase